MKRTISKKGGPKRGLSGVTGKAQELAGKIAKEEPADKLERIRQNAIGMGWGQTWDLVDWLTLVMDEWRKAQDVAKGAGWEGARKDASSFWEYMENHLQVYWELKEIIRAHGMKPKHGSITGYLEGRLTILDQCETTWGELEKLALQAGWTGTSLKSYTQEAFRVIGLIQQKADSLGLGDKAQSLEQRLEDALSP